MAGARLPGASWPWGAAAVRPRARSDAALVRAAQRGSAEAVDALVARHWGPAHRAAFLVTHDAAAAEDIVQEALLSALRALHRFDRSRPFSPWLHRIVVNRAIDWTRARTLRRENLGDVPEAPSAVPAATPAEPPLDAALMAALAALAPEQRAVVVLRHVLDRTPGEIAALLDLPRGTVNSRLRRALDALAAELEARP